MLGAVDPARRPQRVTRAYGALMGSDYGRLSVSAWNTWWFADRFTHARRRTRSSARAAVHDVPACSGCCSRWARRRSRRATVDAPRPAAGADRRARTWHSPSTCCRCRSTNGTCSRCSCCCCRWRVVDRRWMWLYVPASATLFLNMFVIAPSGSSWSGRWVDAPFIWGVAGTNVAVFGAFTAVVASRCARRAAVPAVVRDEQLPLQPHRRPHRTTAVALRGRVVIAPSIAPSVVAIAS